MSWSAKLTEAIDYLNKKHGDIIQVWKPVVGFEEQYAVSNWGNIVGLKRKVYNSYTGGYQSTKSGPIKILANHPYPAVMLSREGKNKFMSVHRIVAKAFISNSNNYPEVNHKDLNKHNYRRDNLEWCTRRQNCKHAVDNGNPANIRSVIQSSLGGDFIRIWTSIAQVTRELGIDGSSIGACCQGKGYKSAGGFVWKYIHPNLNAQQEAKLCQAN